MAESLKNKRYSLFNMFGIVKGISEDLEHTRNEVEEKEERLKQITKEYNAKRVTVLEEILQAQEMAQCTICNKSFPENEVELLFIKGTTHLRSSEVGDSFHDFAYLHQACRKCRERESAKHGQVGCYVPEFDEQPCYYAFKAEKREDGYYACEFGNWIKIKGCVLPEHSPDSVKGIAEEREIEFPPEIEIKTYPKWEFKIIK